MNSIGTRGKWAEKKFRDYCEKLNSRVDFAYYRLPDARAGSAAPTLADFLVCSKKLPYLVEIKEVHNHTFRLPHKNFAADKRARMEKFHLAGVQGLVLVCFEPGSECVWRMASARWFNALVGGSWNMSECAPFASLEEMELF
jgi:hypothetical protein